MASPPRKLAKMQEDDNSGMSKSSPVRNGAKSGSAFDLSPACSVSVSAPQVAQAAPATSGRKRLGLSTGVDKSTVKKLTLKPKPRTIVTQDPSEYYAQSITTLTRAARAILTSTPTSESLQALYTLCEHCVAGGSAYAHSLYDRLRLELERQAVCVKRALADDATAAPEEWLKRFELESKRFLDQALLVRSVFLYLDRTHVLHTPGLLSIWDLALDLYRHAVVEQETISDKITRDLLDLIKRERDSDVVPRPLIQSVITLLQTFSPQSHSSIFVGPFLASSREYYKAEGTRLAQELEPSAYLERATKRLQEEGERCDTVLGVALKGDVLRVVLDELVSGHVEAIVDKALDDMVKKNQYDDLASLYTLLGRVSKIEALRKGFQEVIRSSGLSIVMDKEADDKMVDRLIELRRHSLNIVKRCFSGDSAFTSAVSAAYQAFINKRENKPAEMMAKYLDHKLRSGNRALDDDELESILGDVLFLFRFTQGKDMFEAFYKRDLAKRLLLNKSASFDAERSMLLKLKDECGAGFTSKLEIMFKDIELSEDIMRAYDGSLASSSNPLSYQFDLHVNVLSQGNWPAYPPTSVALPSTMSVALDRFKGFYTSKYSGRTLSWVHALDTCSLKATFPKGGRKELAVSLFQTVVLLLFNQVPDGGTLSYRDIVESTRLDPKEAKRLLQSLACGKVRVLQKHPKGRDVNDDDEFSFNTDFKDDRIRIKINQIQQSATVEENKATEERVFTDRSSHLQLAIVRIMKARKTLKYNELVMEIVNQIGSRFKVEPAEIKKNISSLIDREYMRRADGELNTFEYVA